MSDTVLKHPGNVPPAAFTQAVLEWLPWLEPLPASELTERHLAGLVDASRANSPYFMLLARDPDILGARTRTDKDIFYNPEADLPRTKREPRGHTWLATAINSKPLPSPPQAADSTDARSSDADPVRSLA